MSIPLDLARTLAVVVDEGTLDAAARRLHITPSAVSQRIRALEDQLGRVVLVRSKPVSATEAGDAVVRLARQLALLEHDALAAIGAEGGTVASVPLAVNADSLATWFLPPLARVAQRRAVVFDLHRDDQDFTAGLLESGTVMAAVTSREAPVAGCRVRRLGVLRYEAVATASYADRWFADGVDAEALGSAPVVDFDRRDDLQTQWLTRRGVAAAAPPRHRVPASQDFATAVALGLGWGLLPGFQSAEALRAGELVRLGDDPIDVPLYWQQWNLTSPLLDEVADEIVDEGRRMLAVG
ncbi:LysR family transcriptional regulator (chromosome initiation inhibitor) [Microbacterium testaceum]|uniref:LysR family transcriptional regulator ArgP n=1 Tax=Microbacterium TaxID=33882 RepID=UPI001AE2939F|nr:MULTISPECIES: LysR family transcriptional regulator ArgP [Microbacterium]MDQ1111423.1 LysR family transcriptional regulator (chromosome initiation inhibitor) [Microbacterium testaceum]MDR6098040.1 LysR family transcriptional regulator (chromosome initiation inhibitor) [Microbacterium sp. SORGH_AS_0454]